MRIASTNLHICSAPDLYFFVLPELVFPPSNLCIQGTGWYFYAKSATRGSRSQ